MRIRKEKGLIRMFGNGTGEIAYIAAGPRGLQFDVEFPSDWGDRPRVWIRLGLGIATFAISFPWLKVVPDEGQCSGPRYGFVFFADGLHLHWGKSNGYQDDPFKVIRMPWGWKHKKHELLSEPETYPYRYALNRGDVQERTATIRVERRTWVRPWIPWTRVDTYIHVEFNAEVGEQSGSWKGGCVGCSYDMRPGESAEDALRRMERDRKF
jgi:hypothetical protein